MRTLSVVIVGLALMALGCRTNPNEALLERDLRMQEDRIWHLEGLLDEACAAREATMRENEALKKELAGGDRGAGSEYRSAPDSGPAISAPTIDLPVPDAKEPAKSRGGQSAPLEAPTIELPDSSNAPGEEVAPPTEMAASNGNPTQIVINSRLTGGLDRDGRNGDEGILVVVDPRDAQGHTTTAAGAVSVVVLDPSAQGEAARVARWDFEANEVPGHFQNTAFGKGLQFQLPWPGEPPKNRDLLLFVRFTRADGKKLNADAKITIRAPSDPTNLDRQTKTRKSTESASRPSSETRTPRSRLKSQGGGAPPRGDSTQSEAPAWGSSSVAEQSSDERAEEPIEQASRSGRPEWKPYR